LQKIVIFIDLSLNFIDDNSNWLSLGNSY